MATKKAPEPTTPTTPPSPFRRLITWVRSRDIRRRPAWIDGIATRLGVHPVLTHRVIVVLSVPVMVAVVAGAVALGGALAQIPLPTTTPSAAPATPTRTTATPRPQQSEARADNPCTTLLDPAALADALGGSVNLHWVTADPVLATVGGFGCSYAFGEASSAIGGSVVDDSSRVEVTVAPSAIADPAVIGASLVSPRCEYQGCSATVAVSGWWYSLKVYSEESDGAPKDSFDAITEELETALDATTAPTQASVLQPFDCVSAGGRPIGTRHQGETEIAAAADLLAGTTTCRFITRDKEEWNIVVYPAGAAAYDACTYQRQGTGSTVSVPGVRSAFAFANHPDEYGSPVCATDGNITVQVSREDLWDTRPLDTLSSLLVPMFAEPRPSPNSFAPFSTAGLPQNTVSPLAGGDCSALLDPSAMAAHAEGSPDWVAVSGDLPLAVVGGIDCIYLFGDFSERITGYVEVTVAPSAIAIRNVIDASLTPVICPTPTDIAKYGGSGCEATSAIGGWWYHLLVKTDQPASEQRATFALIAAMVQKALAAAESPERIDAVAPFDCDTRGLPWTGSRDTTSRNGTAVSAAAFLLAGPVTCEYTTDDGMWRLTVYPGSASLYTPCTHGGLDADSTGASLTVPGVAKAYALSDPNLPPRPVCTTDGISLIEVIRGDSDYPYPADWDKAVRDSLGSLLVPVFATAG